jgi:hemerythrin
MQIMTIPATARPLIGARHALGHAAIDVDHFAIADGWMKAMQSATIALPLHLARLRKLMRDHFMREAALVEAAGVSFCYRHRGEHDAMLALCDDACRLAEPDPRAARALLRRALPRMMRSHIISMDQIAVLVIHSAAPELLQSG